LEEVRSGFGMWMDRVGEPMAVETETWSDDGLSGTVVLSGAKDRRWEVTGTVEAEPAARLAQTFQ